MKRGNFAIILILSVVLLGGCDEKKSEEPHPTSSTIAVASPPESPPASASGKAHTMVHDPAHPPIDCPLRKHGVDPTKMKPFEDVEKYIAFLERADRAQWQKPDEVVKALGLSGAETVADVGAGSGYFSFRFAAALPKGKVVAIDAEPAMIRHIHHKAMMEGVDNVAVEIAEPDDPSVPDTADWVFVCDVLHHIKDRPTWLRRMYEETKVGAMVVLVEFKEGDLPEGPPEGAKIPKKDLIEQMKTAGFELVEDDKELLPHQYFLVFER